MVSPSMTLAMVIWALFSCVWSSRMARLDAMSPVIKAARRRAWRRFTVAPRYVFRLVESHNTSRGCRGRGRALRC